MRLIRSAPRRHLLVLIGAMLLAVLTFASTASAAAKLDIYLVRDQRLQVVQRPGPDGVDPSLAAAQALFAGPTAEERKDGISSAIPRGTALLDFAIVERVAYVRVPVGFAGDGSGDSLELRLTQLVYTLLTDKRIEAVRVLLGDEPMPAPGEDAGSLLDHSTVSKREIIGPVPINVRQVQERLVALRYLARGTVTGRLDYRTSQALLAFQGWEGISRTGVGDLNTRRRLNIATIPRPRVASTKKRIEITRFKGTVLLIQHGKVQRAIHVSTGAGGRTPRGNFKIFRKERRSWSVPFKVWLPWASYFYGGIAFHEYPHVPNFPASHGCVRVGSPEARGLYNFASFGTVVNVV